MAVWAAAGNRLAPVPGCPHSPFGDGISESTIRDGAKLLASSPYLEDLKQVLNERQLEFLYQQGVYPVIGSRGTEFFLSLFMAPHAKGRWWCVHPGRIGGGAIRHDQDYAVLKLIALTLAVQADEDLFFKNAF